MHLHRHPGAQHILIADGKGLWPVAQQLDAGTLGCLFYNRPSHGYGEGDIELYVSQDKGRTWSFRAQVSSHAEAPDHVRMNHAVGQDATGRCVAIVSGYSANRQPPVLDLQACVSQDAGVTWHRQLIHFDTPDRFVPFGQLVADGPDGLAGVFHHRDAAERLSAWLIRFDASLRPMDRSLVAMDAGEVTLLRRRNGDLMAVGRDVSQRSYRRAMLSAAADHLALWRSRGGQGPWERVASLTVPGQFPASLIELADGALVLTYGSRITGLCGVQASLSRDGGEHWQPPVTLVSFDGPSDCGYPSTVDLGDGALATVWYAGSNPDNQPALVGVPDHPGYHVSCCIYPVGLLGR